MCANALPKLPWCCDEATRVRKDISMEKSFGVFRKNEKEDPPKSLKDGDFQFLKELDERYSGLHIKTCRKKIIKTRTDCRIWCLTSWSGRTWVSI